MYSFDSDHKIAEQMAVAQALCSAASIATAIEALEALLVEKKVLRKDELMGKLREIAQSKAQNPLLKPSDD